jgi:hypothetical protein
MWLVSLLANPGPARPSQRGPPAPIATMTGGQFFVTSDVEHLTVSLRVFMETEREVV